MTLSASDRLGPYEILSPLGAGGMGEVYRARDTNLGRDVAIKVLPAEVAQAAQRLARFQREAQLLATLNHTNIASIYGLEERGDTGAIVMELVEGPTLADRIAAGAIPVEEALPIAKQIAEALEYAHEKGIVHRDLKPANVKITAEGAVKVLDFGLAKALEHDGNQRLEADLTHSPTMSVAATQAGIILGTAAYMSPEQAKGKPVDRRSDVWSFGVVLYEMLTGRRAFLGEDASETLAAVLRADVDWSALPPATPRAVRRLLERSVERNAKRRLQSIGEARIALEDATAETGGPSDETARETPPGRRGLWPWMAAAVLLVIAGVLGLQLLRRESPPPGPTARFEITLPSTDALTAMSETNTVAAISPDGKFLAYTASRGGVSQLFLRRLNELTARPLPGTEGPTNPFFSPDGKWLAFSSHGKLRKVSLEGGSPLEICPAEWGGGSWAPDGTIVYTPHYSGGLWKVSAGEGKPEKLTEPDRVRGELGHWWPHFLPDGKTVLFTAFSAPVSKSRLMSLSIATGKQTVVLEGGTFPRYVPTRHLLFMRNEGLMAVAFDPDTLQIKGPPVRVLEDAFLDPQDGLSPLAVSQNGTLVYVPKSTLYRPNQVFQVDRQGKAQLVALPQNHYRHPRVSLDGLKLSLTASENEAQDVVVFDPARNTMTTVAAGPTSEFNALWTADGKRLIYNLEKTQFEVYVRSADGTGLGQPLIESTFDKTPSALSPDGKLIIFTEHHPETGPDLWWAPIDGSAKPELYLRTHAAERTGTFSPDGLWVAYQSNASGKHQIYVQAFPHPGERWQVSTEGGSDPFWSRNRSEIFYRNGDQFLAVKVETRGSFAAGKPQVLFAGNYDASYPGPNYDVMPDGRLLMIRTSWESMPRTMVVVLNWQDELLRLTASTTGAN